MTARTTYLILALAGCLSACDDGPSPGPSGPKISAQGTAFQGAAAPGYAVTDFATGFTDFNGVGPLGLAFDASGNLFVANWATWFLYKFGPAGGVASTATQVNATPNLEIPTGLAFGKDGSLFLARWGLVSGSVVQVDPSTGTVIRTVASGIPVPTGLAVDPLSGDLFVSAPFELNQILRISDFATGPGTVTTYASIDADGIAFGADGTLYAAILFPCCAVAKITGTNSPTPGAVTNIPTPFGFLDGIALSAAPGAPFLYVNRNDGIITKIDLTTTPPTFTDIFTGGSRGDFAAVGFDGCLYATQSDRVLKVTNADGTCLPPPLGPLEPTGVGIRVSVDIKPGAFPNIINVKSGNVAVAILSSPSFNAADVVPTTVTLGDGTPPDAPEILKKDGSPKASLEDVNGDGRLDMVLHFSVDELLANGDLALATTELLINGRTTGGTPITGKDSVRPVQGSQAPNYALALTPAALTTVQGATSATMLTISRTNFTGAVSVSLGATPPGVTGVFDPADPTGSSSTLTLRVGVIVAPGVYNLTVNGTAAAGDRSTSLTLTVTPSCDCWTTKAPMPTARYALGMGAIDGIIYAVGGVTSTTPFATVEAYAPATNTWTTKASMPTARHRLAVGVVDGVLYAVGGIGSGGATVPLATVEAYNPVTNSWATKTSMPTARFDMAVGVVDGILYAIGGIGSGGGADMLATVEAYDPATDTWTTRTSMPTARFGQGVAAINGKLYAVGGASNAPGGGQFATVEAYDPLTDTWTTKASMPATRHLLGAEVINGTLYAVGGDGPANTLTARVDAYDPGADVWVTKASMPTARAFLGVSVVNLMLYAVGGAGPTTFTASRTVEAYQP
jgi:N-acetylneuraminic acid mutarotase